MTIFIDMDDVLADTYGKHIELYNKEYGENLTLEKVNGGEVWQNVPEEHQESDRVYDWKTIGNRLL